MDVAEAPRSWRGQVRGIAPDPAERRAYPGVEYSVHTTGDGIDERMAIATDRARDGEPAARGRPQPYEGIAISAQALEDCRQATVTSASARS
jgi:hypothetical protein